MSATQWAPDPPTVALPAPSDPPTDPPFYTALVAERGRPGRTRPSPSPRETPLEELPDPPIYQAVAAELLIDPLPRTYVRTGRG